MANSRVRRAEVSNQIEEGDLLSVFGSHGHFRQYLYGVLTKHGRVLIVCETRRDSACNWRMAASVTDTVINL